jgi:hypothetical protein
MSRKAAKKLERMRRTKSGWRPHDFHTLYLGFGFIIKGRKHDVFEHPDFPQIRDAIPRHDRELPSGYAKDAVKNIDLLLRLKKEREDRDE